MQNSLNITEIFFQLYNRTIKIIILCLLMMLQKIIQQIKLNNFLKLKDLIWIESNLLWISKDKDQYITIEKLHYKVVNHNKSLWQLTVATN